MSEYGHHFGLLIGNWPVGWKLEGGQICKQTGYGGPTLRGKGPSYLVPWGCWASKKDLMGSEQPRRAASRSPSCCRAQGHWAQCPGPGSTGTLAAVGSWGGFSLFGHKFPAGEHGSDFNSWFGWLWLSLDTRGPNKGVKTVELCIIRAISVLESKGVAQTFRCEPMKLGNHYLHSSNHCCESWEKSAW